MARVAGACIGLELLDTVESLYHTGICTAIMLLCPFKNLRDVSSDTVRLKWTGTVLSAGLTQPSPILSNTRSRESLATMGTTSRIFIRFRRPAPARHAAGHVCGFSLEVKAVLRAASAGPSL